MTYGYIEERERESVYINDNNQLKGGIIFNGIIQMLIKRRSKGTLQRSVK